MLRKSFLPAFLLCFLPGCADDGLFYLSSKDRPNTVSGVDQKTGEERVTG